MPQVLFQRTLTFMSFLGHSVFHKSSAEEQYFKIVTAAVLWMLNAGLKVLVMKLLQTVLRRGSTVEKLHSRAQARERSCLICRATYKIVTTIKMLIFVIRFI